MPPAKAKRQPDRRGPRRRSSPGSGRSASSRRRGTPAIPGPVPARRLSNAEYDNTIRDLTGVDLRPTREFPVDPANEAGFDNSAESLAMSPALAKKYLEAARQRRRPPRPEARRPRLRAAPDARRHRPRQVLRHGGSSTSTSGRRPTTPTTSSPPGGSGTAPPSAAPMASLDDFADEAGLSRKYLATVWTTLTGPPEEVGPIAALQALWRELPAPEAVGPDAARAGCERMRDFVVELRRQLVPEVKNLTARGISERDAAVRALEEPPVRRQPDAVRRRRVEGPGRRPDLDGAAARALAVPESRPRPPSAFEATLRPLLPDLPRRLLRLGAGPGLPRPEEGEGERRAPARAPGSTA